MLAAFLAVAIAAPAPEAKADPKASVVALSAPLVAAPVAYSAAYTYTAPLTYAAAPLAYSAYSSYATPYVSVW